MQQKLTQVEQYNYAARCSHKKTRAPGLMIYLPPFPFHLGQNQISQMVLFMSFEKNFVILFGFGGVLKAR
jgi:hypothetical protein